MKVKEIIPLLLGQEKIAIYFWDTKMQMYMEEYRGNPERKSIPDHLLDAEIHSLGAGKRCLFDIELNNDFL